MTVIETVDNALLLKNNKDDGLYLFLKSNMKSYKYGQGAMILKKLLKDLKKSMRLMKT